MIPRDRTSDPLQHLRFALETMPGSRKYVFTPATRAEILSELYVAFWGPYAHLFLPNSNSSLPLHKTLSQVQSDLGFSGAGRTETPVPGMSCSRIFKKGDSCFRCKECALDDSCVMCASCFHGTNHVGHNVSFFIAQQPGGCCDCGDEEAWRVPLECPTHPPARRPTQADVDATPKSTTKPLSSEIPPVPDYPHRASVPPELQETMRRTVGYALDFVLDTLDYSPDESTVPLNEADLRLQPSADPMMKDQYCVVLWNDDKHSFEEVIKLLCDMTNRTREEASVLAHRIDENGREIIDMNTNVTRLLEMAQAITQIDLGVTIRRAYDTFREQVSEVIIEWLLDLTRSRLGTDYLVLREVIASELMSPRRRDNGPYNANAHTLKEIPNPARLDSLFLYHTRLWKKPRLSAKEIYASVISLSSEHKLYLVIDAYLLVDREAETSIKYFALQLFTVPSVALHVVRNHKLISRLLSIITAFFTNQITDKHIAYPPASGAKLDVDSFPFKSKRFMPVFSDLRYLCHTQSVQELIANNHDYIVQFAKTCQLFMCVNPNKRAVANHVEYETDAWISVFNVTLSLSRVIKTYGEAYSTANSAQLVAAIQTVVHHILMVCTLSEERHDTSKFLPTTFHEVSFGNSKYEVIEFDVLEGWVSFHHSLHWLLAELFKHINLLTEESLAEVGLTSIRDVLLQTANDRAILTVIDFPLRVLAMIAQIRTGLWVRNGFAIRGQLLHYRDYMLRELCYDQDLFVLQVALVATDPSTIIVTTLDRFGLLGYFGGEVLRFAYEGPQLSSMVEELLYVLITILTETANPSKMPINDTIRREIIHALAMGPCSYTDLVKRVAERLVEDVSFEKVLDEVAHFKSPETATESGVYELKDENYEDVNPFFYHYTRNKREEVETILRNRLKKKTGVADPVLVPKPFSVASGPFARIPAAFESEALLQVMFYSIYNILTITDTEASPPPSAEAILDQALHLVMVALVERAEFFASMAASSTFQDRQTLLDILCTLEHHEKYPGYKSKIHWILTGLAAHVPDAVLSRRRVIHKTDDSAPNAGELRKRAAKARQEAIMQQMKQQQASFAINFDDADDDDDEDMETDHVEHVSFGTCIVCQEDVDSSRPFGALAFLQASRFIRRHPDSHSAYLNEVLEAPPSMDRVSTSPPPTFPPTDQPSDRRQPSATHFDGFPSNHTRFGLHASVCSHMMHLDCFHQYSLSIRARHRAQATRNHPETISRKEYICPLCKSLGNILLPVSSPIATTLNDTPFPDWIRTAGINILKSKPDPLLESLQFRNGTGEFVFWSAQDSGYSSALRNYDREEGIEIVRMMETVMVISKSFSQQSRHLRDRPEPELGERGAGIYLPEEIVGYTIAALETSQRGTDSRGQLMVDNLSESHMRMIRGVLACLTSLVKIHFQGRPDEGRDAVRQAIIKRLLPEWSRTSLTSFSYPLLLRDPFTILVETAAVAPEILRHVLVLTYYACLARAVIGLVYVLNKTRSYSTAQLPSRSHEDVFGDVRMFFMSVVRHSPVFEHTATLAFETFGEARIEKLLYAFTLPFLRKASILCRAVLPSAFPTRPSNPGEPEYNRLLTMLNIPPLSSLPYQDTLQNALSGWCAHYGHSHAASQLNCGVMLDFPSVYRLARLPLVLDDLFGQRDRALTCLRCNTIPNDAAICLLCGMTVCMQSNCCTDQDYGDRGECNMHTQSCGGTVGVYFLVKRCSLLYLFANNGTFGQSPYLDSHGEIDISMRRGYRQFLHHARWEEVRKNWLNHQIPTLVARKLESTLDSGGWETL
ncbi:hypothetical protein DXG03_001623 [Asterophora parasitica]|uniref:E3 ubiquitin-protein ligase n=1 Tax=Asterophora parasitica TaxID=117018 RepID=A0A9P7G986_9AGAR|nr:hypothetical protein DXG03_001623 [Asterophora parasitica]